MADSPVLKALAILKCLSDFGQPIGVQQVASESKLNVSTVHRLLQLMVLDGMVSYDPTARVYGVGPECIRLATRVLGSGSLIGRVRPIIAHLAERLEETCAFSLYEPKTFSKIVTVVESGPHPLGYVFEVGTRDGIHAGASGKPILAFLSDQDIERMLRKPLPKLTEYTVVSPDELRKQIRQIRKRGYSTSRGERVPGAGVGVGAPVFGPKNKVVGSVVVTIPSFRWNNKRLPGVAKLIVESARQVSAIFDVGVVESGATT